ncbi:hypothetical protein KBH77_00550 [Patescibacteria group bacterium]|nr:hypothetical protein [Patescibacteria group bacterium]
MQNAHLEKTAEIIGKEYNEPSVLSNLDKPDKKQYNEPTVLANSAKTDTPHNTQKKIAEEVGLGHSTIGRVEVILKEAPEEVKDNYYIYIYISVLSVFMSVFFGFLFL